MPGPRRGADAGLELRLLGPLEAASGADTIALGGQKPRTLLAMLALEPGRVVSVDRLVEALWPGEPPETAAHAIQVYVSQLRKALGAERLVTRAPGYVLETEPERVDIHRFTQLVDDGRTALQGGEAVVAEGALREALDLWRGPALVDFLYEPFAQTEIARLEELRLVAVEERVDADLGLGRHVELVSELEALVTAHPLRERPRAQLMLALYRSGRQADALAAYRVARDTLLDELGLEPGPDLKQLESAILRQDESLLLPETAPVKLAMQFRRLVTIVFVDVVESMALADALDPEALGVVLRRYFDTVSAALTRHGGTVEKYAGDSVMAAFGVPVSHEDDALRAARAALEIRTGIAALAEQLAREHGVELEVRIGLESGEVVATPTDARQRLVTGEAVGVAARLQQSAAAGEIVVGALAGRLIDHAATLEPLGELAIKGKREPVRAYRLVELAQLAPAFESGAEAPLTGRKRELAALRRSLKRAVDSGSVRVALVAGAPGVGKSRLAAELVRRTRGITALWGRCLSYGDGITYWPLREAVRDASAAKERDAVLAALHAETPPPAPEIALLFRRLCERLARDGPLVLVFDDVHWAEPTFLELLELVAERGQGPILVVCLARDELLEERPDFLEGRENVDRIVLDQLSSEETDALLDRLGGATLESDQRARIVETAEGNPFFLEQLLALAVEGGLAARELPATVQALLAARLDRLGPGERAVLERGAVVGKDFSTGDVVSLLDPDAVPTADTHLRTLAVRGFVRPRGEAFTFRHALVREAVYRASPKRLRAELHERYADRLDETAPDLPELDEFTGYHLEQAHRLRIELGESDRRTEQLAEDAGRRLGEAGIRAWKRVDVHATTSLLGRATSLLPGEDPQRLDYLCELGIALRTSGEPDRAAEVLDDAITASVRSRDRRAEIRARIEREYVRFMHEPGATADGLLDATMEGVAIFETVADERALGRAWLLRGFGQGGHRGRHKAWEESAERALAHYKSAGWPTSTCLGQVGAALYYGPTPVLTGIARCDSLLHDPVLDRAGRANVTVFLAGLLAQRGDFGEARARIASARATYDELGMGVDAGHSETVLADVELYAGDAAAAERTLRQLCVELERTHQAGHLASRAADLADVLYAQGRFDEAETWTRVAEVNAAADDVDAQLAWMPVRAKILASQAAREQAARLADEVARRAGASDGLNRCARAFCALSEVFRRAGRSGEANAAFRRGIELYEQKGNVAGVARARALHEEVALV
jgi:class 3 adenylate cyclase/tetratricopeptide (TPR) repeat protein